MTGEPVIVVRIARQDLLKYTTRANLVAAALMIRVRHFAFAKLSPAALFMRRGDIRVFITPGRENRFTHALSQSADHRLAALAPLTPGRARPLFSDTMAAAIGGGNEGKSVRSTAAA